MANVISPQLHDLLTATNLGRSTLHPLAGWQILSMLYRDGSTASEPMTMGYLVTHYNAEYLEPNEARVADDSLRGVMKILVEQARLVTSSTRRVRERMNSGKFHTIQSAIYRINAAGIEYLKAMQRVIDAENTVVASTKRISEYVQLVDQFRHYQNLPTDTMQLYEDFTRMLGAFDDVMNGLRKLDVDLHDVCSDLAFDKNGQAADHLRQMLHEQAIPAYQQMMHQATFLQWLKQENQFADMVAQSRQASGNLDVAVAIGDQNELAVQRHQTKAFVARRLAAMVQSFDPSTTAIQTSFDSIYLLFQTLIDATELLAREYEHVQAQTIDIQALTKDIDQLITQVHQLVVPTVLPAHLPMDRLLKSELVAIDALLDAEERTQKMSDLVATVRADMLEAGSMPPIARAASVALRQKVTAADNPAVAVDADLAGEERLAIAEFEQLLMPNGVTATINHDVECQHALTRDAIIALYPATQYQKPGAFSAFGRQVLKAKAVGDAVQVHLAGEDFAVCLPHGFEVAFG